MEQTWFDLPVESRLTEVWPRGLLKKTKMVPVTCKPADMSSPMPYWNLPIVPMDQKMPLLPGPKDLYHLSRSKLGKKLWTCEDSEFSLNEFIKKEVFNAYEILHDPNLAHYLHRPKVVRRLKELGLVDSDLGVMCNLRDFNYYRRYLAFVHTNAINKLYKKQFIHGDKALDLVNLCINLEKQDAKQRVIEEIDKRHAEVFKELEDEQKKKSADCARRLRRVAEVYEKKKMDKEAKRIATRVAGKEFSMKVKENLYYANAQLRQHKLDTMRKWKKQNIEKTALFEEREKKKQDDIINKKTEWFQNKIKHQEKRVLQETQINVLMDHEFSPEYKKYLKFIKRENYKNPPERDAEPVYGDTSESEIEDSDLLNQLRLFSKAGYQMQRGSFISKVQARKSVAKLATSTGRASNIDFVQVRRMSEKFVKEKHLKGSKRQSMLNALINSSILRLLSPSLQDVFKKSERKWRKGKKTQKNQTSVPPPPAQQISEQIESPPQTAPVQANSLVNQPIAATQGTTATQQTAATQETAATPKTEATQESTSQQQTDQQQATQPIVRLQAPQTIQSSPQPPVLPAQDVNKRTTMPSLEIDSLEDLEENALGGELGMLKNSEIEIRPPNKTIPPPPICHLNVYRYFDRILGKVILEYVTRVLLPKFPEIFNRCYWVSKAEGLPEDVTLRSENPPCNPEDDSIESVSECLEQIQKACDKKMSPYMLLLSESPDIRLFRHKFNGIGEITCSESLVDNYMVQSSPHPQHILDYIHWRADWILNHPTPKTYQEIYDLKYVIGVMKSIECPVFQPIYKLWEITNDINLNPEVIEKFNLYMEKKKEQKPMIELNPLAIAVKNVKKTMSSLYMDNKAKSAVDDLCLQDPFKFPSELFRLAYLKRPVDPKIWKILDDLLDKTKRAPDTTECLKSFEYQFRQSLSEKTDEFEEIQLKAPECLFVDPRDYAEELRKAKEKAEAERQPPTRLRFGITEFIPFIENALFGKAAPLDNQVLEEEVAKEHADAKVKKASALRFSLSRRKSSKLTSRMSLKGSKLAHQRKETNLAEKLLDVVPEGKKKKKVVAISDAIHDNEESKPSTKKVTTDEETSEDNDDKVNKEDSVFFDTGDEIKPSKTKAEKVSKGGKKKDKKDKDKDADKSKKKDKEEKIKRKAPVEFKKNSIQTDGTSDGTKKKKDGVPATDAKKKEKVKIVGLPLDQEDDPTKEKDDRLRIKSMSIMKTEQSSYKSDVNVSFKSKTYIEPHLLKTLDVQDLKKSKERAPTPHSSFSSLDIHGTAIEEINEPPPLKKDLFKTSIMKMIPCTVPSDSEESIKKQESISEVTAIRRTIEPVIQTDVLDKEMVLNVISAEEEVQEEEKGSEEIPEIDSDLEHLRDFVSGKIPRKHVVAEKKKQKESLYEPIPVPPIINKSLLAKRRIIKRPLANILRKIYGWVMTTVIRRRLLISYGLPPKIRKECFYIKKYNPSEIDMARGLAKLILEEQSEFYPFAVLEPYIETILEQTMDSTKRFDFTKRIIRMEVPLNDKGLVSLQQFLKESEQDIFFKKARVRRLRKFSHCIKMKPESIWYYADNWASSIFNPHEWEDIFKIPKLEIQGQICAKKKHTGKKRRSLQQQKSAFISYGGDSPEETESSASSSEETKIQLQAKHQSQVSTKAVDMNRKKSKSTGYSKTSVWLQTGAMKKPDAYDEWKPGFVETKVPSKQKILEIIINKSTEIVPSITEINDDMRKEFEYHKLQRRWMEKERQLQFITHLNIFNPVLPPVAQDRKLMKFVQSPKYPFHGTFMSCETFTERKSHPYPQDEVINEEASVQSISK